MKLKKDKSIIELVAALLLDQKGWTVKDYWDADMCAIGIASKVHPDRLVYVSTFDMPEGRYCCECEVEKSDGDLTYDVIDSATNIDFAALVKKMLHHLGELVPSTSGQRQQHKSAKV